MHVCARADGEQDNQEERLEVEECRLPNVELAKCCMFEVDSGAMLTIL